MAGSGLHHCSPGKCACRGPPARYTTGGSWVAQVTSQPAVPHHKPPTRGIRGGGHC